MDTHLVTQDIRLKQWAVIIQDRLDSGLTIDAYCEKNGLSRNAYFYWLRKMREKAIAASAATSTGKAFIEIGASNDDPSEISNVQMQEAKGQCFYPQLTIQKNEITVGVNASTPKSLLEMVMEVVSNAQ